MHHLVEGGFPELLLSATANEGAASLEKMNRFAEEVNFRRGTSV